MQSRAVLRSRSVFVRDRALEAGARSPAARSPSSTKVEATGDIVLVR